MYDNIMCCYYYLLNHAGTRLHAHETSMENWAECTKQKNHMGIECPMRPP